MAITTRIKERLNAGLSRVNLHVDSLTAERLELNRLRGLVEGGYFDRPAFPLPVAFTRMETGTIQRTIREYSPRFTDFEDASRNDVGYSFDNGFFRSPDAEVLYAVIRQFEPQTVVEVGSGNSTKITRQAILDGQLNARLICIDPQPRTPVHDLADEVFARPVEQCVDQDVFRSLGPGDVLFIDSSHMLSAGNDAVALFLRVIPELPAGVLIHVHDVFLPWDYPKEWVLDLRYDWNEQYLVQAMLTFGDTFEVLWAGHYFQRTDPQFSTLFPRAATDLATSLWFRKK